MIKALNGLLGVILVIGLTSCGSQNQKDGASDSGASTQVVKAFLKDISTLEEVEEGNPIVSFQEGAEKEAYKVFTLAKEDAEDLLNTSKGFRHCVITVGDHTIVKIRDYEDCTQSGSWGFCMPMVEGYVKKGELIHRKDYANNIIGTPDNQERKVFLFK